MNIYGLIGKNLSHSFSKKYFSEKFLHEKIGSTHYELFELDSEESISELLTQNQNLKGLNVTIPFKETILPYMDGLDPVAKAVQAVNCIRITNGKLIGYNTDVWGFSESLKPLIHPGIKSALVLGSGGASKAIHYVLGNMGIQSSIVSRNKKLGIAYLELDQEIVQHNLLIINTTPLGMFPNTETFPDLPYQFLKSNHVLYDLVYNPEETIFLQRGREKGAKTKNGLEMLKLQAEKSWEIWTS